MRKLKIDELNRLTVAEFKSHTKFPITVVLDNIRSAHNIGSVFRTCDALASAKIILTGISARPPHKEISKSAIGATMSVEWSYFSNTVDCINGLKAENHVIIGVEQTTESINLQRFPFELIDKKPIALIFGNEVEGLSEDILTMLDYCIDIPQFGTKHSFNVSVCAGIVLWEFTRRMIK